MKKIIIMLIISLTLIMVGVLYASHSLSDAKRTLSLVEAYMAQFPETMPDAILDPMVGYPVF